MEKLTQAKKNTPKLSVMGSYSDKKVQKFNIRKVDTIVLLQETQIKTILIIIQWIINDLHTMIKAESEEL